MLLHPRAAIALVDLALRLVGAPLLLRALQAQRRHLLGRVAEAVAVGRLQSMLDRTMQQQVRVTTDRRGEVAVSLQREPEVALVLDRVYRQALRAQQHRFQQRGVGSRADLLEQVGEVLRLHQLPGR